LTSDPSSYIWSTHIDHESIVTTLPVLNQALTQDNSCHHNSGANRHVFHDRQVFEEYEPIVPLTVKGFGHNLSTVAVGKGSVRLKGFYGSSCSPILLHNVLHIPAARSNLISGVQLDKAGVVSTLGNNSICLSVNGQQIVSGHIINDMYRLDLQVVFPKSAPLLSRLGAKAELSQVSSSVFYTA
jgi:hypothetical protein